MLGLLVFMYISVNQAFLNLKQTNLITVLCAFVYHKTEN